MDKKLLLLIAAAIVLTALSGCPTSKGPAQQADNGSSAAGLSDNGAVQAAGTQVPAGDAETAACEKSDIIDTKSWCYINIAKARNDEKICLFVQDQSYRDQCYEAMAFQKKSAAICDSIVSSDRQGMCQWSLSNGDQAVCAKIKYADHRDSCYSDIIEKTQDKSLCDKITSTVKKTGCMGGTVTPEMAEAEYGVNRECPTQESYDRTVCITGKATSSKDASLCLGLQDKTARDSCISGAAYAKRDASECSRIDNSADADKCKYGIAVAIGDKSACSTISALDLAAACAAEVDWGSGTMGQGIGAPPW